MSPDTRFLQPSKPPQDPPADSLAETPPAPSADGRAPGTIDPLALLDGAGPSSDPRLTEASDTELMKRASTGDMTPYAVLFKRHADRIWRIAYLILHSVAAAEDVVQETFTRGLSHLSSYRGEAEPKAWFSSIALNMCRHILRDRKKEAELVDSDKLEHGARVRRPRTRGVLTSAIRREGNRILTVALGYLTEAQREVFVLHYVDELPYEDVAKILNMRAGAARALAHRAKAVLQKRLGPEMELMLGKK